jgi:hypothetical protein
LKKFNYFFTLLFITIFSLFTEEVGVRIGFNKEATTLSVTLLNAERQEVLETLNEGLKAQIIFSIKLYERSEGLCAFLGDRLVEEYNLSTVAYRDFFTEEYVIESWRGEKICIKEAEQFFTIFFSLKDFSIQGIEEAEAYRYYVLVRVQLDSVKLIPPFTILSFLPFGGRCTSPWVRMELSP